ncbi:hypothetical protein RJT34_12141 [Clitoria ternatea]|uniref:Uncharacterized protein n=1 Tax=Clitoria ternatea TaxID=43366 RepID=A0AAN9PJ19_CLITE
MDVDTEARERQASGPLPKPPDIRVSFKDKVLERTSREPLKAINLVTGIITLEQGIVENLPRITSDHSPILLRCRGSLGIRGERPSIFKLPGLSTLSLKGLSVELGEMRLERSSPS